MVSRGVSPRLSLWVGLKIYVTPDFIAQHTRRWSWLFCPAARFPSENKVSEERLGKPAGLVGSSWHENPTAKRRRASISSLLRRKRVRVRKVSVWQTGTILRALFEHRLLRRPTHPKVELVSSWKILS